MQQADAKEPFTGLEKCSGASLDLFRAQNQLYEPARVTAATCVRDDSHTSASACSRPHVLFRRNFYSILAADAKMASRHSAASSAFSGTRSYQL